MKEIWYTIFADNAEPTTDQIFWLINANGYTKDKAVAQKWADYENERIKESHPNQKIRVVEFSWPPIK